MFLHIATSRDIGRRCIEWAEEEIELVSMDKCDVFVSVLYDKIIAEDFIQKRKCFNFHPGILPWYRGAGAYSWAIINGELETGVTLHEIDKSIDTGPVIEIRRFPISKLDTAESLFRKSESTIYEMFLEWLPKLLTGAYKTFEQEAGRTYYRKDLEKARDLTRFIRAFTFKDKPRAYYINEGLKIYL